MAKALLIGGTAISAASTLAGGAAEGASADYRAAQHRSQATAETATGSREAFERRRESDLILSRARAVGASSGGGQDLERLGELEQEGTYRVLTALYEGEERSKARSMQARAAKMEGRNARSAVFVDAATTLVGGASSYERNFGMPKAVKSFFEQYG
ncbi:MAG: hypothetical protein AAF968_18940 [Pseudomonadota bacterium]